MPERTVTRGGRLLLAVGAWVLRVHSHTLRFRWEGRDRLEDRLARGLPVVLVAWHQRIYMGMLPFARYRPIIMISRSRDGERIARIVARFGWQPVRGSSSKGGAQALEKMIPAVAGGEVGAHIVDGPRGPARRVKPGTVALARRAGAVMIPVYVAARRRFEARSWDRFQVPLPFSRVLIRLGAPIEVPRELSGAEQEAVRQQLEKTLEQGYAELDAVVRGSRQGGDA
jgi:lysophospholipid acyltransferase (LPLAT)-like uncharacterized protein